MGQRTILMPRRWGRSATFIGGASLLILATGAAAYQVASLDRATTASVQHAQAHPLVHRSAFAQTQVPLVYRTAGHVSVGLPNGPGVLAINFFGHLVGNERAMLHLFAAGVPQPTGKLGIDRSRFDLRIGTTTYVGHLTSFDSTAIAVLARSNTGTSYRGIIQTSVNAVTHTFSAKLTLDPLRPRLATAEPAG